MSQTDHVGRDASGINDPPGEDRTAEQVADQALLAAIRAAADVSMTIARSAGELVAEFAGHDDRSPDTLTIAADCARALGTAADLWVGLGAGLAETRQRVLAGADRTINLVDAT